MKFGIEKCAMLLMRIRKSPITEGTEQPNQVKNQNARKKVDLQELGDYWERTLTSGHESKNSKWISQTNKKTSRNQAV